MVLGGFQEKVIVRIVGGGGSTGEPLDLGTDNLLAGLTNQGNKIQVDNTSTMVSRTHLERAPGGQSNWKVLGDPDTINWGFAKGSTPKGSKCG